MTSYRATLRLEPAVVTRRFLDGNIMRHPESHFLDLVVDGRPVRLIAGEPAQYMVTELNRPWLPEVRHAVDRLVGRRPSEYLPPGRVALLVCADDGDVGCGQLTTAIDTTAAGVTWSDFRWEGGLGDSEPVEDLGEPISFNRGEYEAAFADAYERVAAFPYDELAHHGRRFLWPWQWGWSWGLPRD